MSEQIINDTGAEVASIGELGTPRRGDRIYHNATEYHQDFNQVQEIVTDIREQMSQDQNPTLSRAVFRGIVSPGVMRRILDSHLVDHIEVGVDLQNYGEPGWLVYVAINSPERQALVPVSEMVTATSEYAAPHDFDPSVLPAGFVHRNRIPPQAFEQLRDLWLPFDWTLQGVAQRADKVQDNLEGPPAERDTWFSGIWARDRLVCAATAERLTYQGANGDFDLVESTEWSTDRRFRRAGQSLMSCNLWHQNQEILTNLGNKNGKSPFIFAEANFMTRADRAGRRAGFQIPERQQQIGQMIIQNVVVNDGLEPVGRCRDFTFLAFPPQGEAQ